ncbi:TPA: hypothetical protein ACSP7Z_003691 [Serratia fonticola]
MVIYSFFVKGEQIVVLDNSVPDFTDNQKHLLDKGYAKQFEELQATSPQAALARFKDIRGEEYKIAHAFTTGGVFTSLIGALLPKG